jgi:hypothetical protein
MRFFENRNNNFKRLIFAIIYSVIAILAIKIIDFYLKKSEIAKYEKCYNALNHLMKFNCFVGIDLTTDTLSRIVKCDSVILNIDMNNEISNLLTKHKTLLYNLKNEGCSSIEIFDNMVQLWYNKYVVDIEFDSTKNRIISDISDLK